MKNKKTILICLIFVGILAVSSYMYNKLSYDDKSIVLAQKKSDKVMLPEFTLIDMNGNEIFIKDMLGKPTIINFWATWCGYCIEEMPHFQKAYEKYKDKINFIMIDAVDGARETVEIGKNYIEENEYTFPVYFDTKMEAVISCGIVGFPTTLFVSSDGEILLTYSSYLSEDKLMSFLASMAGEK